MLLIRILQSTHNNIACLRDDVSNCLDIASIDTHFPVHILFLLSFVESKSLHRTHNVRLMRWQQISLFSHIFLAHSLSVSTHSTYIQFSSDIVMLINKIYLIFNIYIISVCIDSRFFLSFFSPEHIGVSSWIEQNEEQILVYILYLHRTISKYTLRVLLLLLLSQTLQGWNTLENESKRERAKKAKKRSVGWKKKREFFQPLLDSISADFLSTHKKKALKYLYDSWKSI